jgi:hypothetical protein
MEQIQRTARRERLIREIASKVRRAPDMKAILSTTARELNRAFNATSTSIQLHSQTSEVDEGDGGPNGQEQSFDQSEVKDSI